jgi:hypothetical protein
VTLFATAINLMVNAAGLSVSTPLHAEAIAVYCTSRNYVIRLRSVTTVYISYA